MTECGCELCTTSAMLRRRNPAHGRASTYRRYGCRCEACTRAASEAQRKSRANHQPSEPAPRVIHSATLRSVSIERGGLGYIETTQPSDPS